MNQILTTQYSKQSMDRAEVVIAAVLSAKVDDADPLPEGCDCCSEATGALHPSGMSRCGLGYVRLGSTGRPCMIAAVETSFTTRSEAQRTPQSSRLSLLWGKHSVFRSSPKAWRQQDSKNFLTFLGSDTLQGELLGHPMQADDVMALSNTGKVSGDNSAVPDETELV